jgi:tetratricopeptide (TPR) repeat protein
LGFAPFSFFSYPLSINFALFFLIVFIALISNQISIGSFVSIYKYLRFAVIVVLLLTMALLTKKFVICKQVQKIFVNNINDLPLGFHEKYYYYMCHNSDFMNVYSKFLFDNGQYEEAIPVMERTITLKASSELVSDYGFAIEKCGKDEEAEAAYKLAKAMTPGYVKPSYRLFLLYKRNGYIDLALNEAYHILKMKAKVVNTTVIRIRNEVRSFIKIKCHD